MYYIYLLWIERGLQYSVEAKVQVVLLRVLKDEADVPTYLNVGLGQLCPFILDLKGEIRTDIAII